MICAVASRYRSAGFVWSSRRVKKPRRRGRVAIVMCPSLCFKSGRRDRLATPVARQPAKTPKGWRGDRQPLAVAGSDFLSVLESEHPDHSALRHLGFGAAERVEPRLHSLRVDAPGVLAGLVGIGLRLLD